MLAVSIAIGLIVTAITAVIWRYHNDKKKRGRSTAPGDLSVPSGEIQGKVLQWLYAHPDVVPSSDPSETSRDFWGLSTFETEDGRRSDAATTTAIVKAILMEDARITNAITKELDTYIRNQEAYRASWNAVDMKRKAAKWVACGLYTALFDETCPLHVGELVATVACDTEGPLINKDHSKQKLFDIILSKVNNNKICFGSSVFPSTYTARDQAMHLTHVLFTGACGQIASALSNTFKALAATPRVQERVAEKDTHGFFITTVITEQLRMFPVQDESVRVTTKPIRLPSGVNIPANARIVFRLADHHQYEFEKPTEFLPERWEVTCSRDCNFLPFGLSPKKKSNARDLSLTLLHTISSKVLPKLKFETALLQSPVNDGVCLITPRSQSGSTLSYVASNSLETIIGVANILKNFVSKTSEERREVRAKTPAQTTNPTAKRVAVLGAGPAGLSMVKELLEEGHIPVAFESTNTLGGVFASCYEGGTLTSSNVNTSFGAFSAGEEYHPYMHSAPQYVEYLYEYAEAYDLLPHIQFKTYVTAVNRSDDGTYAVSVKQEGNDGEVEEVTYEGFQHVAVCCGGNGCAKPIPTWEGMEKFKGSIIHSKDYVRPQDYKGKRVLVVGLGESGSDISLHIAQEADAVAMSTRNGPGYVIPRRYLGLSADVDTNRMYHATPRDLAGGRLLNLKVKIEDAVRRVRNHPSDDMEILKKAGEINTARGHHWQKRFGTKNLSFVKAIVRHGALYKPGVKRFTATGVEFVDGSTFECDSVVCCVGYKVDMPFLKSVDEDLAADAGKVRHKLFKHAYHPRFGTDVTFAGYVRPGIGSIPPIVELQARYFALLISGKRQLPSMDQMLDTIEKDVERDLKQYPDDAKKILGLTDFMIYLDWVSEQIGCKPHVWPLFVKSPALCVKTFLGPINGMQFRLEGPGAVPEFAQAVLERVPLMPIPVLAYEVFVVGVCKVMAAFGFKEYQTIGL